MESKSQFAQLSVDISLTEGNYDGGNDQSFSFHAQSNDQSDNIKNENWLGNNNSQCASPHFDDSVTPNNSKIKRYHASTVELYFLGKQLSVNVLLLMI